MQERSTAYAMASGSRASSRSMLTSSHSKKAASLGKGGQQGVREGCEGQVTHHAQPRNSKVGACYREKVARELSGHGAASHGTPTILHRQAHCSVSRAEPQRT